MKKIPLKNRAGEVVAYALVDDEDYGRVIEAGPWHRIKLDYVVHTSQIGYRQSVKILLHRFVLGLHPGDKLRVDHIDHNPLNNCKANLRLVTQAENLQNTSAHRGSTSKHRGVWWHKGGRKWMAEVRLNGKSHYLGLFEDELKAAEVAAAYRRAHMPFSSDARPAS